jgi:hypothetical protein
MYITGALVGGRWEVGEHLIANPPCCMFMFMVLPVLDDALHSYLFKFAVLHFLHLSMHVSL